MGPLQRGQPSVFFCVRSCKRDVRRSFYFDRCPPPLEQYPEIQRRATNGRRLSTRSVPCAPSLNPFRSNFSWYGRAKTLKLVINFYAGKMQMVCVWAAVVDATVFFVYLGWCLSCFWGWSRCAGPSPMAENWCKSVGIWNLFWLLSKIQSTWEICATQMGNLVMVFQAVHILHSFDFFVLLLYCVRF